MVSDKTDVMGLRQGLLAGEIPSLQFFQLWREARDTRFFAKDAEGRFLAVSPNLVALNGLSREEDMVGLSDYELYPHSIAEKFRQDDASVVGTGIPLTDMVEIFLDERGTPEWYVTHKFPIRDRAGAVVGVMGTSRKYVGEAGEAGPYPGIGRAIRHLREHLAEEIPVPALAELVHMSARQFQRAFAHHFKMPPSRYRIRMRVMAACDRLLKGNEPVGSLAYELGFPDESAFIAHFKRQMGATPLQYRLQNQSQGHRQAGPARPSARR